MGISYGCNEWCTSVADWLLSEMLNIIKESIMKAIEKVNVSVMANIIVTAVVGAGALLCGEA